LPPIEVIQIGEHYFVNDGHHRISVARALGIAYIDALVEVWQ
jgi:ParB-like chromosome segregation protein Spo0J